MFKKIVSTFILFAAFSSSFTLAQHTSTSSASKWVAGISYSNFSDDDISLSTLNASIGYKFGPEGEGFKFIPEFRLGFGVGDDEVFNERIEIETLSVISLKGQYDFSNNAYLFATVGRADVKVKANFSTGGSGSASNDETGYGIGAGFNFSDSLGSELSFETYDDTDIISLALKFYF